MNKENNTVEKIELKADGDSNFIEIKGKLAFGKIYAMINALSAGNSDVAREVMNMLSKAVEEEIKKNPESVFGRVRRFNTKQY